MKKPIVFMFSGQGSQYYHMGRELYEEHPRFRLWMDHCDEIVHALTGTSLIDVIYREGVNKSEPFDRILHTNPALLCIEYSLARVLMETDIQPDYLLGYSLGEIAASVVSGAVSLEDGLQLSVEYARLLEENCRPAGMLAIIESEDIVDRFPGIFRNCSLSGRNFEKNFVVSGLLEDIQRLQEVLRRENIVSQRLPVNYGFHTELMDPIEDRFKNLARKIVFSPISIPVVSTLKAGWVREIDVDYLWDVVRHPVEFGKTVRQMLWNEDYAFIDVGPSGTLATFVKYLLTAGSRSTHFETINQFGRNLSTLDRLKAGLSIE